MRDHEEKKYEQNSNPHRRPSGAVERLFLREGDGERDPLPVVAGQPVDGEQQKDRKKDEANLELVHQILQHGLIVDVPCEEQEEEEDCEEEEEVDGEIREVLKVVVV